MLPINERLSRRDATVFVAMDTIDPLIDHLIGLVGTDREMVRMHRYRTSQRLDSDGKVREDPGLTSMTVETGLHFNQDEFRVPVVERTDRPKRDGNDRAFKGVHFHLSPGLMTGFGISADDYEAPSEGIVRERYWGADQSDVFSGRTNLTVVRVVGWPGSPSREDRIEIEDWNEHGVCSDTIIAFSR